MRKTLTICLILLGVSSILCGQGVNVYDLLTEPSLTRPLTLHKGFLQFYGGYSHFSGNNYFDETGTKLPFTEAVRSIIENSYQFDLSYGISEYLEFHAGINYRNRFETFPTYMVDNHSNIGYVDRTYHYNGITNLNLDLKYRLPVILSGFDMFIYGGLLAPVSSQHTHTPDHSIILLNAADPGGAYVLQYEFNPAAGSPATYYTTGLSMIYVFDKLGVSVNLNAQQAFSEVETYNWGYRLYGDTFEYYKHPYSLRPKGLIFGNAQFEAQVYPWFAVRTAYDFYQETAGWSDETGQAISLTRSTSGFVSLGFEIQVSTHLRLVQHVYIPVNGKYTYSEFSISTGLRYNIVPLQNVYY